MERENQDRLEREREAFPLLGATAATIYMRAEPPHSWLVQRAAHWAAAPSLLRHTPANQDVTHQGAPRVLTAE